MNCSEFRERFDAWPALPDAESGAHAAGCPGCTEYAAAGWRFETALARALRVETPADIRERALAPIVAQVSRRRFVGGLAATLVVAAVAGTTWRVRSRGSLERELLAYLAEWPAPAVVASSMATTDVNSLLLPAAIEVDAAALRARVAKPCIVRGTDAIHLLLEVDGELVSVIVMPALPIREPRTMRGNGMQGTIVPGKRGSLAIVASDTMPSSALVEQVRSGVRYL
jgi:hypothetical protein